MAGGEVVAKDRFGSKALGQAISLATNMAAAVAVGFFLGNFLDKRLGTSPWLTLLFFLLGTATGFKMTYEAVSKQQIETTTPETLEKSDSKDNLAKLKEVRDRLREGLDPKDEDQGGKGA